MLNLDSKLADVLRPDLEKNPGIIRHRKRRNQPWHDYVFLDFEAFSAYARRTADSIAERVIGAPPDDPIPWIRTALTLAPAEPVLNALRAFHSEPSAREAGYRLARASLRSDEAVKRFDLIYRALLSTESESAGDEEQETYDLIYQHGAAAGGGLDIDVAARFMVSLKKAGDILAEVVQREFAFVRAAFQFRLFEMEPGSATFRFIPSVADRSRAERVARYMCLYYLQETLKGNRPDLIEESPDLARATQRILEPSPGTESFHTTLSDRTTESLDALSSAEPLSIRSQPFTTLAVVSGVHNDVNAELLLAPDFRFSVSTTDDGEGHEPSGASAIKGTGEFLRNPYVVTLVRERNSRGAEKFVLRELRPLVEGVRLPIDSFGSTIVQRAVALNQTVTVVRLADGSLESELGLFGSAFHGTLETAMMFLREWRRVLSEYELAVVPEAYLPPAIRRPEPAYVKVLRSLAASSGGVADVKDIAVDIARRYRVPIRSYRIRVAAHRYPELFGDESDYDRLVITDKGRATVKAYDRATNTNSIGYETSIG